MIFLRILNLPYKCTFILECETYWEKGKARWGGGEKDKNKIKQ